MAEFSLEIPDLEADVVELMQQVPAGRVTTFGRLGSALGDTQAARWLASDWAGICERHDLPGYRIVLKDGRLPDYGGLDPIDQARRLRQEGVPVSDGKVPVAAGAELLVVELVHLKPRPLDRLRVSQEQLIRRVQLIEPPTMPEVVGGLDVSYVSSREGVAGYSLVEVTSGRLVDFVTVRAPVFFPYIPGFLAYREIPLYLKLLEEVRRRGLLAPIVLVDGNGLLHPRLAGVATHLGIVAELATIGISKSLLCGDILQGEPLAPSCPRAKPDKKGSRMGAFDRGKICRRPVVWEDRIIAQALWTSPSGSTGKRIYVSAGHRVTLDWSVELTLQLLHGHKLPEPTYWADRVSHSEARGGNI